MIIINIFNELTKISREPEIKITELRDILKKYAKTVSVFDEMNATCIIREDCKYMQKNIQKEYLEVYIKYFFKKGEIRELVLKEDIPFGHKIAIHDIPAFVDVIKYGESMRRNYVEKKLRKEMQNVSDSFKIWDVVILN